MPTSIDRDIADHALSALEVDAAGLDAMDRRYLTTIAMNYGGGPVGVETMAAALSEPRDAIEDIIEPYLIQCGYLQRTPRGRLLTSHAFRHLGLAEPSRDAAQFGLFGTTATIDFDLIPPSRTTNRDPGNGFAMSLQTVGSGGALRPWTRKSVPSG